MQIVIDLPNENYEVILTKVMLACRGCKITELVKGHGRLIDADELLEKQYRIDDSATLSTRDVVDVEDVDDAPTIIEALKQIRSVKNDKERIID